MTDRWMIRGTQFVNCNCALGCPCQFNAPTTHGFCEALSAARIEEGTFNDVRLDDLAFLLLIRWPGEIADGDGCEQVIIDERADAAQREAIRKIAHGESTSPGTTHFYVFNSTCSEVLETLFAPIDLDIDLAARRARVRVPELVESTGSPIIDPHSGQEHVAQIRLPRGFEYTVADVGVGHSRVRAGITLDLDGSHGHFCELHMNQDGVIRP